MKYLLLLILMFFATPVHSLEKVDTQLVILIDTSGSISTDRYVKQQEIIRNAFKSPNVIKIIQSNFHQSVAVTVVEFSGANQDWQLDLVVMIPWTKISTEEDINKFIGLFSDRRLLRERTNIGNALSFAVRSFDTKFTSTQRVINIYVEGLADDVQVLVDLKAFLTDNPEYYDLNINSIIIPPSDMIQFHQAEIERLAAYAEQLIKYGWKSQIINFDSYEIEKLLVNNFTIELM